MRTTEDQAYKVKKTERGNGYICPQDHCGGKMILDPSLLGKSFICPYCECVSLLPKETK